MVSGRKTPEAVMCHRLWSVKPELLGRLVELATQILVFAEQPQPE